RPRTPSPLRPPLFPYTTLFRSRAGGHIRHLHVANPEGRVFPRKADEYDYAPFFAALRTIGYDKRISVEASTQNLTADAPQDSASDRKSTRLNSSHGSISYAVFC